MDVATIQAQITAAEAILAALNAAILALADPTVQKYTIDTGQSVQTVWRHDLASIIAQQSALMNQICTLQARLSGSGVVQMRPAF